MKKRNVGILIFEDAEVLDFAGPFEVFSVTSQVNNYQPFDVFTVAKDAEVVKAVNGLQVKPDYTFHNHPAIDILIISGGQGSKIIRRDQEVLDWVKKIHDQDELTLSICSGSRVLGTLGLLDNKYFCTHHTVYDNMFEIAPTAIGQRDKRFIQSDERIYTSGGISAGIDLSLHIVEKLLGIAKAKQTAEYMEYNNPRYYMSEYSEATN